MGRKESRKRNGSGKPFTGEARGMLEGYVITETCATPLPQQYDSFVKVVPYATGKNDHNVYRAIADLTPKTKEEFLPDRATFLEQHQHSEFGQSERLLQQLWEAAMENAIQSYRTYETELHEIFVWILGQLDERITTRIKARDNWKDISAKRDTIELLKSLRDVCYDTNQSDPDGCTMDIMDTMKQFFTCAQTSGQGVDDYIHEVETKFRVLKNQAGGGSVFSSKPLLECTIERKFPEFRGLPYDSLSRDDRTKIEHATDEIVVATVIVEGSKKSWKHDRVLHYAEIAGVRFNVCTGDYE